MSTKQISDGQRLTLDLPAGGVTVDEPEIIGNIIVVPLATHAAGAVSSFVGVVGGVWSLPKQASLAINEGDLCYWDTAADEIDTTTTNTLVGVCVDDAAGSDTEVTVRLFESVPAADASPTFGDIEIDGALNHDGSTVGFYGATPATQPAALTQTFATASRTHAARGAAALTENTGAIGGTNDGDLPDLTATAASMAAVTTVGANTGTAGAGLSLIGDTTAVNQAANLMNDLAALREDIADAKTQVDALVVDLAAAVAAIRENATMINSLVTDQQDTAGFVNAVVDDLQTLGLEQ